MTRLEWRGATTNKLGELLRRLERPVHDHEIARAELVQLLRRPRTRLTRAHQKTAGILEIAESLTGRDGGFSADRITPRRERRLGLHPLARTKRGLEQPMQHGAGRMPA